MSRILLILFFVVIKVAAFAQQSIVLNGQPNWKEGINIANNTLAYEEVSDTALSLTDIQQKTFLPFKESDYRFAQKPRIVQWLKFKIVNTSNSDSLHLILDLDAHFLVQLYQENILLQTKGTKLEKSQADHFGLHFSIPPKAVYTYYARMEERIRYLTPFYIHLETPDSYFNLLNDQLFRERWLRFALPLMTGVLLVVFTFGLFQYYLLKDKAFLYYFIYALSAFLLCFLWMEERFHLAILNNMQRQFGLSFLFATVLTAYVLFVNNIIGIHQKFNKSRIVLKALLIIAWLQAIIFITEAATNKFLFTSDIYYSYLQGIPSIIITAILFVLTIKSNSPVKRFIASGLGSLILFFFLPSCIGFINFFHLPYTIASIVNYVPSFFIFGITIEAICFALALAYRTKIITDEKNALHFKYAEQLKAELQRRTEALQQQSELVEAQKIKQLQTEFDHKIAETEMTALRAQMNPHFIFNCLNSIKLYTLENDSATASEYLTKFSQLIRLVLENSRSEKVTLEKEIETLKLYIEMEAMRFKNKVRYCVKIDKNIDAAYIEIPPLLIQPYVENAIWHGLMHKKEGGLVNIHIAIEDEHLLHIEISDNGIGREQASAYKSKSVTRQKSFGLKMTSERIGVINHIYQTNTSVQIIDEKDAMNNACGTTVIIEIPV
jgi:sensor histidine kinase YesM